MKNLKFVACLFALTFFCGYTANLIQPHTTHAGGSRSSEALSQDMLSSTVQILKKGYSNSSGYQEWYTAGSGFHLGDGYIATAFHVVQDYQEHKVRFNITKYHGRVTMDCKITLVFPAQDVAILYVKDHPRGLKRASLSSDVPQWGDPVVITGSPMGIRTAPTRGDFVGPPENYPFKAQYYWVMCNSWHGNSGGPVWDAKTEKVIGVLVAGPDEYPAMSLIVPIKHVMSCLKSVKENHGKSRRQDGK